MPFRGVGASAPTWKDRTDWALAPEATLRFDVTPFMRQVLATRAPMRSAMRRAALQAAMMAGISAILIGCAAPGVPTARHPIVPQAVKDLSARQQGNGAVLTFTLPSESTDKKKLVGTPAVEIYRSAPTPSSAAANKPAVRLVDTIPADLVGTYVEDSRVEFRDEMDSAELARQPGQQVTYTVRTRVSGER